MAKSTENVLDELEDVTDNLTRIAANAKDEAVRGELFNITAIIDRIIGDIEEDGEAPEDLAAESFHEQLSMAAEK